MSGLRHEGDKKEKVPRIDERDTPHYKGALSFLKNIGLVSRHDGKLMSKKIPSLSRCITHEPQLRHSLCVVLASKIRAAEHPLRAEIHEHAIEKMIDTVDAKNDIEELRRKVVSGNLFYDYIPEQRLIEAMRYASPEELITLASHPQEKVLDGLVSRYDYVKPHVITKDMMAVWETMDSPPIVKHTQLPPGITIHRIMSTHLQEEAYDLDEDGQPKKRHCIADEFRSYRGHLKEHVDHLRSPRFLCFSVRKDGSKLWTIWYNVEKRIVEQVKGAQDVLPGAYKGIHALHALRELARLRIITPQRIMDMQGMAPAQNNNLLVLSQDVPIPFTEKKKDDVVIAGNILITELDPKEYVARAVATHGAQLAFSSNIISNRKNDAVRASVARVVKYIRLYGRKDIAKRLLRNMHVQKSGLHCFVPHVHELALAAEDALTIRDLMNRHTAWENPVTKEVATRGESFALKAAKILLKNHTAKSALHLIDSISKSDPSHPDVPEVMHMLAQTATSSNTPKDLVSTCVNNLTSWSNRQLRVIGIPNLRILIEFISKTHAPLPKDEKTLLESLGNFLKTSDEHTLETLLGFSNLLLLENRVKPKRYPTQKIV